MDHGYSCSQQSMKTASLRNVSGQTGTHLSSPPTRPLPLRWNCVFAALLLSAVFSRTLPCAHAATLTDSFNTNVDYLTDGIRGTIWDGVYFGAGEFANTGVGG